MDGWIAVHVNDGIDRVLPSPQISKFRVVRVKVQGFRDSVGGPGLSLSLIMVVVVVVLCGTGGGGGDVCLIVNGMYVCMSAVGSSACVGRSKYGWMTRNKNKKDRVCSEE